MAGVLIDWTGEFDRWYDQLIERAKAGDERSLEQLALVDAELGVLQDLRAAPDVSTPTLRGFPSSPLSGLAAGAPVRPRRRDSADRLVSAGSPGPRGGGAVRRRQGRPGGAFYDSVGLRADAAIDSYLYLFHTRTEGETHE